MKRGIILTPDEPVWDVQHLDALIEMWLDDCTARLPVATVTSYRVQIDHFRRWMTTNGPALNWELRQRDMQRFVVELESRLAYNTSKGAVKRLRMMLHWANVTNRTEGVDYRPWVTRPKGSLPVRVATPITDLLQLLDAAAQSPYPARDRAILAVLLGAGLRRGEAAALNVEDVTIYESCADTLVVREAKVVEGRENQWRLAAFDAPTGRYIRAWLEAYGQASGPLFPSLRFGNDRLGPIGLYKVVKTLIRKAGLCHRLQGPHDLRRNFVTYFARQRRGEVNGQLISKQVGHSSFTMTSLYNLQDADDLLAVIASPFKLIDEMEKQDGHSRSF